MRKEEATSASESDLSCESYRGLVSGPHYEEADFEVAFSPGARVIGVIQQEPLPHDTVGCNRTHINVYKRYTQSETWKCICLLHHFTFQFFSERP